MDTFAIFHRPLIKHLEEQLVDVVMGFFNFIQQYHAPGMAAYRFRRHAAFAIADVAGRRAFRVETV
ncbi:hypothetical protein GCM10029978_119990 [Actinoallomurus acanthiterrae]